MLYAHDKENKSINLKGNDMKNDIKLSKRTIELCKRSACSPLVAELDAAEKKAWEGDTDGAMKMLGAAYKKSNARRMALDQKSAH